MSGAGPPTGYAVTDPEVIVGLRVLAAPVREADAQSVAAISAAAPSMNITLKKFVDQATVPVMQAAAEMGKVRNFFCFIQHPASARLKQSYIYAANLS